MLQNSALCLKWEGGDLQVENRLSGTCRSFDFPAFMIRLGDVEIPADRFVRTGMQSGTDEVAFDYRHDATGIRVRVRYWIDGDNPWFRKAIDASGAGQSKRADAGPALGGPTGTTSAADSAGRIRRPRRARRRRTDRARHVRPPCTGVRVSGLGR